MSNNAYRTWGCFVLAAVCGFPHAQLVFFRVVHAQVFWQRRYCVLFGVLTAAGQVGIAGWACGSAWLAFFWLGLLPGGAFSAHEFHFHFITAYCIERSTYVNTFP